MLYPIIMGIVILLSRTYYTNRLKKYLTITVRGIFLLCLVLALADMSVVHTTKETTTIFLSDLSDSTANRHDEMREFIRASIGLKQQDDLVGSVVFGRGAYLDAKITENLTTSILARQIDSGSTDIEQGLMKSMAMLPKDTNKRIVLLTDGKQNKGDMSKLAHAIKGQGIDVRVKLLESQMEDEVYVERFYMPQKMNLGEKFRVHMDIYATTNTEAKVTLIADGEKIATQQMALTKGTNQYVMSDTAKKMGFVNYELLIEPLVDTNTINNSYAAYTLVESSPKILILYDEATDAAQIEEIAGSIGLEYDSLSSNMAPTQIQTLLKYKSIILCNVSAENLAQEFLDLLEPFVKDFGGGMVAIGGENAYALGGYYKTSLEKVLPVNMHMKGIKDKPSIAMMLVLDKSGSMAGFNLKLAKTAAVRTLEVMEDRDEIGVVAFDDKPYDIVELQKAENREEISSQIFGIKEGGGTSILPALKRAYEKLTKSNAEVRHIILLTDGQAERSGYRDTLDNMNGDKITLSTIGIGTDTDKDLLIRLAEQGNGRYYVAMDGVSMPRIFAKEAFLAMRTYINNTTFTPTITSYHSILSSVYDTGLPKLHGYIGTSPKDAATVLLTSPMTDPILTTWQYGLGKTVAWTSDLSGQWSRDYNTWGQNHMLWQSIINYTIENYSREPIEIESSYKDGQVEITMMATGEEDHLLESEIQIQTPSGKSQTIMLEPVRKGVYTGNFIPDEIGAYMLKGVQKDNNEVVRTGLSGMVIPYSEEYKIVKQTHMDGFIKSVDGVYIDKPDEVFSENTSRVKTRKSATNSLLLLAMIVFLIDIAIRRLNMVQKVYHMIEKINKAVYGRKRKAKPEGNTIDVGSINKALRETQVIKERPRQQEEYPLQETRKSKPKKKKSLSKKMDSLDTDELLGRINKKK